METGIELIAQERKKQLTKGRSTPSDVKYNNDQQLRKGAQRLLHEIPDRLSAPYDWDVELWQKMCGRPYKERLIIAGALIAAELDRIQMVIDEDNFQQNITTMTTIEKELMNEVERLILHAEEGSLDYSVLEHARKLIFKVTHPDQYATLIKDTHANVLPDLRTPS